MSTKTQEVKHALTHFFFVYTVVLFMKVWFPTQDFFRSIWWKVWGHDPKKDINFHLGQISFDDAYFNRMIVGLGVQGFAEHLHGKDNYYNSTAWRLYNKYTRFKYIPYHQFVKIEAVWKQDLPGVYIRDWFLETDGITKRRVGYFLEQSPAFKTFYLELMAKQFSKPQEETKDV